jgi:hypothetical protein
MVFLDRIQPAQSLATIAALTIMIISGTALMFFPLAKSGSALNQMFEVFIMAATLSFTLAMRLGAILEDKSALLLKAAVCISMLSMCALPLSHLIQKQIGRFTTVTAADLARKESFSSFLKPLKKPLFIDDEIYSLPWNASDNKYPTIKMDPIFYKDAEKRGIIKGGVPELIKSHWFASVYVPVDSALYRTALAAQYREEPLPADKMRYLDCFNEESPPCALLTAP